MTSHSRRFARRCREHFADGQPQQSVSAAADTQDAAEAPAQPAPEEATAPPGD